MNVEQFEKKLKPKDMSEETEDLRDRFFNELTRKRVDGVMEFNCLPHAVFEWIRDDAQQTPVTDEQIEKMAEERYPVAGGADDRMRTQSGISGFVNGMKTMRDLQPKTDDWVSVDERLLKLLVWYQGKSENYRRVTLLVNVLKDFNSLTT